MCESVTDIMNVHLTNLLKLCDIIMWIWSIVSVECFKLCVKSRIQQMKTNWETREACSSTSSSSICYCTFTPRSISNKHSKTVMPTCVTKMVFGASVHLHGTPQDIQWCLEPRCDLHSSWHIGCSVRKVVVLWRCCWRLRLFVAFLELLEKATAL